MPQQAQVRSVDAVEAFRSNLIVYLSQARPALEEVTADVLRARVWLENDQRTHWEHQLRLRQKVLEQAQQALFSSRLGALRRETAAEQMAVQRAKRDFDAAETKLRVVKRWARDFEGQVQPLVKQMEKLHTLLSNDMVKAVAYLTQTLNTLAAYSEVAALGGPSDARPASGEPVPQGKGAAPTAGGSRDS